MIRKNHRRKGEKRTEHAPTWEGSTEGQHGVAKGRRRWKRHLARKDRRREARIGRDEQKEQLRETK